MSLSSFLRKLRYGSYKNSPRASVYKELAQIYEVLPQHVYEIAHGKKMKTRKDQSIFEELLSKGIIVNK